MGIPLRHWLVDRSARATLLFLSLGIACLSPAWAQVPGSPPRMRSRVSGVVTDTLGQPLPGATVTIPGSNITATSDAAGRVVLEGVPVGTWTLSVRRMGFR